MKQAHEYTYSRPQRPLAAGTWGGPSSQGWGCPCWGRRACCPRPVLVLFLVVLAIYLPLNALYIMTTSHGAPRTLEYISKDGRGQERMSVEVSNIVPGPEGKVDLVLSIDLQDLVRFLDNMAIPDGAATANPLPRNTTITLHNPARCENKNLEWLVYIHSAPQNKDRRMNVRNTWANINMFKEQRFTVVFLMGKPESDEVQATIQEEFKKYGDIVQGDFVDHYKNLTLKGIMGLQWATRFCQNAPLFVKADDDAFVNIFEVMHILEDHRKKELMAACPLWKDNSMPILRDPKKCMKWCVKYSEFPGRKHFPRYCAGLTFILSRNLAAEMYRHSLQTPFFWIDDVYVTGLLTGKVKNVEYVDFLRNFTLKEQVALDMYMNMEQKPTLYFVHIKKPENFQTFWKLTLQRLPVSDLKLLSTEILDLFPDLQLKEKLKGSR